MLQSEHPEWSSPVKDTGPVRFSIRWGMFSKGRVLHFEPWLFCSYFKVSREHHAKLGVRLQWPVQTALVYACRTHTHHPWNF